MKVVGADLTCMDALMRRLQEARELRFGEFFLRSHNGGLNLSCIGIAEWEKSAPTVCK